MEPSSSHQSPRTEPVPAKAPEQPQVANAPVASSTNPLVTASISTTTTLPMPKEDLRERLKDNLWRGAVYCSKGLAYGSTAIVAAVTIGQFASIALGYNPFEVLHTHHVLSHVSTAAHMTVMFLAASAGFGLWRFRQTEDAIAQKLDTMLNTFGWQKTARDLLKSRLSPLQEHVFAFCRSDAEPLHADPLREAATNLSRYIGKLEADPGGQEGQRMSAIPRKERVATLCALYDEYINALQSSAIPHPPVPRIDLKGIEADLQAIATLHTKWEALHEELWKLLPKISPPQAHALSTQIHKKLLEIGRSPDTAKFHAVKKLALEMETSCTGLGLPGTTLAMINHAVKYLQGLPDTPSPDEMKEIAGKIAPRFDRISSQILDATPGTTKYDLLRFQLHHSIRDFSKRYPNSSLRASVAGLVAAVSYWVSCEESLNALLPTATDLYANSEVGHKLLKEVVPFILQGSVAFAAGALHSRFKPHLAWASLELSRVTFSCVAPFAWVYEKGQRALDRMWGRIEEKAVGNINRKRE